MSSAFLYRPQHPADKSAIDQLHEDAFGPGRFARTAYRVREACIYDPQIALTAWNGNELIGAVHLTAIRIGGQPGALLLGPLAIAQAYKNKGHGLRLIKDGLTEAERLGYQLVILVGDLPYYQRAGFGLIPPGQIMMPGPVDHSRFLAAELGPNALGRFKGMVAPDNEPDADRALPAFPEPGQHDHADEQSQRQEAR